MLTAGLHDLRNGVRSLYRNPVLSALAVVTLALGIAVNATVFSWVDHILLNPMPGAAEPERLVSLEELPSVGQTQACAYPDFRDFQHNASLFEGLAAWHLFSFTIGADQSAQRVYGQFVSANFFSVLGVKPAAGRLFSPGEDRDAPVAYPYAVISNRLWLSRFQSSADVVGRTVRMNGRPVTIIGVAPAGFQGAITGLSLDVWVHLSMIHAMGGSGSWPVDDRDAKPLVLIGRLRPGVTVAQADAQVRAVAARISAAHPDTHAGTSATVLPLAKSHAGAQAILRSPLQILLAISMLVLLIACANVANLLLARAVSRSREYAVQLALGAGSGRLLRAVLAESCVLAVVAGAVALLFALWMGRGLILLLPATDLPLSGFTDVEMTPRMMAYTVLACAIAALFSGIAPALYASRIGVRIALSDAGRGTTSARTHRGRGLLVVAEVALASLALIGAALFTRSFRALNAVGLGFDPDGVQVARLFLSSAGYTADQEKRFCAELRRRLEHAPGVAATSCSIEVPLAQTGDEAVDIEGYQRRPGESMVIARNNVGPGYFRLLRIPLVDGREFTDRDTAAAPGAVIVNETFARRYFPGQAVIGRHMRISLGARWFTIVGVVRDSKYSGLAEAPRPYVYAPFAQAFASGHDHFFYVRAPGSEGAAAGALRNAIAGLDPSGGLYRIQPLRSYVDGALYPHYVAASLMSAMGALSLLLASIGLYSVMAYAVRERTQEIGVRMALGAQPAHVLRMVLRQGMRMTLAGLAIGVAAAAAGARLVRGALAGIGAADPLSFCGAAALLCAVAALACYLPGRRATRIEPMSALRGQ